MEITIFRKVKEDSNGRKFNSHFAKIKGEFYDVRFVESKGAKEPPECPCNIEVQPGQVSIKTRQLTEGKHAGETFKTLYVYSYGNGSPFVDHSADELFSKK